MKNTTYSPTGKKILQENIAILCNKKHPSFLVRTPKFIEETPLQFKSRIDPHTVIVGDFNTQPLQSCGNRTTVYLMKTGSRKRLKNILELSEN